VIPSRPGSEYPRATPNTNPSLGDADGLGAIRKGELVASCRQLGVRHDSDVTVLEHALLPDSMTTTWPAGLIADLLGTHARDADVILTFDGEGVSSHPNHISLLHGVREYIKGREGGKPRLYTLTSVGLARKYISALDAPMAFLQARRGKEGDVLLFVNTVKQTRIAQKTMTTAHKSQMRWFRWGWIVLSRYMVVNDLKLDKLD
jgi:N-acetylglucosaminylphosphatidylinositol deacetylase